MSYFFASLTRISNLAEVRFDVEPQPRDSWATGDYVVGEVSRPASRLSHIELANGRMVEAHEGDRVVGALGRRYATLEATGDWKAIGADLQFDALTSAGLFGKTSSASPFISPMLQLVYRGHVLVEGRKATMRDYVSAPPARPLTLPVVLLVGTSMSAGKSTAARIVVRQLKKEGLRVVGAKLTGAGRYRDILGMHDAGADYVFDFVDVGLPSTVCPEREYRAALSQLLSKIEATGADVLVAEAGASPLEPYNVAAAIEQIERNVRCTVLCASDPYAVVGVIAAFGREPDVVAGVATSTDAGVALVERLSGHTALNLLDKRSLPELNAILKKALGALESPAGDAGHGPHVLGRSSAQPGGATRSRRGRRGSKSAP